MSSASALDPEELENVPLVRMEDVQPDRSSEKIAVIYKNDTESDCASLSSQGGSLETFVVDGSELCVEDDDSNIGSMVSIKSEEMIESEMIVPEILDSIEVPLVVEKPQSSPSPPPVHQSACKINITKPPASDSWPTLEILPGGVINLADKADYTTDNFPLSTEPDTSEVDDMIYACAKCSQRFKYLFCLVKHVRWHEEEAGRGKVPESKLTPIEKKMVDLERRGNEMDKILNSQSGIIDIQIEPNQKKITKHTTIKETYICLHSGKRKIVQKPKRGRGRPPKKLS